MGISPSFPIQKHPVTYEHETLYTPTGERRIGIEIHTSKTKFQKITEQFCEGFIDQRQRMILAKSKFEDIDFKMYSQLYGLSNNQIIDIRSHFTTFDMNQDGIIDFHELCAILQQMGDRSTEEERRRYFDEVDVDGSDCIEFDEFLALMYNVSKSSNGASKIGDLCANMAERSRHLWKLSLEEQLEAGVFF